MSEKIKPLYLAQDALNYVMGYRAEHFKEWLLLTESLATCAIEGNQMADELVSTINRLDRGVGVGDRWILQLAYYLLTSWEEKSTKRQAYAKDIMRLKDAHLDRKE